MSVKLILRDVQSLIEVPMLVAMAVLASLLMWSNVVCSEDRSRVHLYTDILLTNRTGCSCGGKLLALFETRTSKTPKRKVKVKGADVSRDKGRLIARVDSSDDEFVGLEGLRSLAIED